MRSGIHFDHGSCQNESHTKADNQASTVVRTFLRSGAEPAQQRRVVLTDRCCCSIPSTQHIGTSTKVAVSHGLKLSGRSEAQPKTGGLLKKPKLIISI